MIDELISYIKEVFKDEVYTNISLEIQKYELAVFLAFDPDDQYNDKDTIKLVYDGLTNSYIDNKYYTQHCSLVETGLDSKDLDRISAILKYMDKIGPEFDKLTQGLLWSDRITKEQMKDDYRYN